MTSDADVVAMVTAVGSVNYGLAARQTVMSLLDHTDFRIVVGCDARTRTLVPDSPRITSFTAGPRGPGRAEPFLAKFDVWSRALGLPDARILIHVDADAVLTRALRAAEIDEALGSGQLAMVEQTSITGSEMNRESFRLHYLEHSHAYLAPDHPAPGAADFRFHNTGVVVVRALELANFLDWAEHVRETTDGSHTVGRHMIADQDYLQVWTNVFRRGACTDLDWTWNHCEWWDDGFPRPEARIRHFSNFCNGPSFGTAVSMELSRGARARARASTDPRLTAVIVTRDSAGTIGDCLAALAGVPGMRVLVVDNDSSDATRSMLGTTTVIANDRNTGFGAAANQGVAAVETDIVCLLNPDCFVTVEAIDAALHVLDSNPRSVVVPRFVHADGSSVHGRQPGYTRRKLRADILESGGRRDRSEMLRRGGVDDVSWHWPLAAFMVVRVDVFRELGGFDRKYFCYMEDVEFGAACTAADVEVVEIDVPVVHLGSAGSAVTDRRRLRLLDRSRLQYARRHHGAVFAARLHLLRLALRIGRRCRPPSRREPV